MGEALFLDRRSDLSTESGVISYVARILEECGIYRPPVEPHVLQARLNIQCCFIDRKTHPLGHRIRLDGWMRGNLIVICRSGNARRDRFTQFEEIAHVLREHDREQRTPKYMREREAKRIAAELIVPTHMLVALINEGYTFQELLGIFAVTDETLTRRCYEAGIYRRRAIKVVKPSGLALCTAPFFARRDYDPRGLATFEKVG